jgi:hypothetical protein
MKQIVAFVGFKSAGKNTAAIPLIERWNYWPISFADAMKDALASIFCWPRDLLEGITDESREWRERVDPWWASRLNIPDFTPRYAMRFFGTDVMRQHFNSELWVLNVERRIQILEDRPVVLIDARFANEIALARKYGGIVARIKRGPDPAWMDTARRANILHDPAAEFTMRITGVHQSEWAWVGTDPDVTIPNDDSIDTLHTKVVEWVTSTK